MTDKNLLNVFKMRVWHRFNFLQWLVVDLCLFQHWDCSNVLKRNSAFAYEVYTYYWSPAGVGHVVQEKWVDAAL